MSKEINTPQHSAAEAFASAATVEPETKPTVKYPRITLRVTLEENTRLRALASGQSVSAYIRANLFGETATPRKTRRSHMPVKDQQAMARALALLGKSRMANNLNQLAHHANIGTLPVDDETRGWIEEAHTHVTAMRDALVTALGLIEESRR